MTTVESPDAGPALPGGPADGATGRADGALPTVNPGRPQPVAPHGHPEEEPQERHNPGRRRRRGNGWVVLAGALAGSAVAGGVAWWLEPARSGGPKIIEIRAFHSRFEPDRVTVKPGETVRFVITNVDPIEHEFIIGPPEIHELHERGEPHFHAGEGEVTLPAGATVETTWTFGPSGGTDVAYGCHLAGHWTYGMHGRVLVR